MKIIVLMLSREFPKTHSRSGEPTGFRRKLSREKLHTMRGNKNGWWDRCAREINEGKAILSVRQWLGKPYRSRQMEIARYTRVGLQHVSMSYSSDMPLPTAYVDGKYVSIYELAMNDGLELPDFIEWFFTKDNVFDGVIIQLTDFKY